MYNICVMRNAHKNNVRYTVMFNFLLESTGGAGGSWIYIVMLVLIVGMFFFMSRSQKKRDKEAQDMRDALQVGDEVTTIGGIVGKVVFIKDEIFDLETTKQKTRIRVLKGAIRSVDVKAADIAAKVIETKKAEGEEKAPETAEAAPETQETKEEN